MFLKLTGNKIKNLERQIIIKKLERNLKLPSSPPSFHHLKDNNPIVFTGEF